MIKNDKKEDKEIKTEENTKTKTVEEKTTTNKTKEEEKKKHKIGVRTPIYKKMGITLIGISNKAANEAVMKLNNTDKKILQGAIIDSSYCKVYRKVVTSLYDEKHKDAIASLFSNKNIKCLLEDSENSLALATKLKDEIKNIVTEKVNSEEEPKISSKTEIVDNKVEEAKEIETKKEEVEEVISETEEIKNIVTEKVNSEEEPKESDHSNYDNSWKNYEPKGGSRFFSSLGLKIAFIKNAIITH